MGNAQGAWPYRDGSSDACGIAPNEGIGVTTGDGRVITHKVASEMRRVVDDDQGYMRDFFKRGGGGLGKDVVFPTSKGTPRRAEGPWMASGSLLATDR